MSTALEKVQGRVINTFLKASGLPAFKDQVYFVDGVMEESMHRLWNNRGKLSSGEKTILAVALEIWTWEVHIKIFDVFNQLPADLVALVVSVMWAWKGGIGSLEAWIQEKGGEGK